MALRRVGILGGMGPEATILLMQKIIAAVPARDDADHVPLIVDQNPQVPSRIRHLIEKTGEDPAPVLAAMARRLTEAGAEALAMPCNTAHHYAPAIRAASDVPLLDMVALSVTHARERAVAGQGGKVGILASPAVRQVGLFDAPLRAHGLEPVYCTDDVEALLPVIRMIKADGPGAAARSALAMAAEELRARGANVQLIACTEFSMITDALGPETDWIDTLDCLVSAIVDFSRGRDPG